MLAKALSNSVAGSVTGAGTGVSFTGYNEARRLRGGTVMADYETLLLTAAKAVKLDDEVATLKALAAAAAKLDDLKAELAKADIVDIVTAEDLLARIAAKVKVTEVAAAFKALNLEGPYGEILKAIETATQAGADLPQLWRSLFSLMSRLPVGDKTAQVAWALSSDGAQPVVQSSRYSLKLGGSLDVHFDAGASLPGGGRFLKLGAKGGAEANGKATIPYSLGSIAGEAGASAAVGLDYYFKAPDGLYIAAVAERLGGLPDPFGLAAVWRAFEQGDLESMVYSFEGAANASVKVSVADTRALGW